MPEQAILLFAMFAVSLAWTIFMVIMTLRFVEAAERMSEAMDKYAGITRSTGRPDNEDPDADLFEGPRAE